MNKKVLFAISAVILAVTSSSPMYAKSVDNQVISYIKKIQNNDNSNLKVVLEKYLKYSNDHNLKALKELYATSFVSADGLNKNQILDIIKDTWTNCPDIKYVSDIKSITFNDNYAFVESVDKATATTRKKSEVTNDFGQISSVSNNITYFQKFGNKWKIVSDKVSYESTSIKYGSAKNITFEFYAPAQVPAGNSYTATLKAKANDSQFLFASISNEPITYPQADATEVFRQINPDSLLLERIMKSNTTNNNELTSASVGVAEITKTENSFPKVSLTGLAVLFQRVNVIPKSSYINTSKDSASPNFNDLNKVIGKNKVKS